MPNHSTGGLTTLPEGFFLDDPLRDPASLPQGFVVDAPVQEPPIQALPPIEPGRRTTPVVPGSAGAEFRRPSARFQAPTAPDPFSRAAVRQRPQRLLTPSTPQMRPEFRNIQLDSRDLQTRAPTPRRPRVTQSTPPRFPEEPDAVVNAISAFGREFARAGAAIPKGLAGVFSFLQGQADRITGLKGQDRDVRDLAMWQLGEQIEGLAEEVLPADPRLRESFLAETLPGAAGSMAAFILGGVGARILKLGAAGTGATVAGMGAAMEGVGQFEQATQAGASPEDAALAAKWGALIGTSEALPIFKIFERFDKASAGGLRRILTSALAGGTEELTQETFQGLGGNVVAQQIYDKERGLMDGVLEQGAAGGILGTVASLIASSAGVRARGRQRGPDAALPSLVPDTAGLPMIETPEQAAEREGKPRNVLATGKGQDVVPTKATIPLTQNRNKIATKPAQPLPQLEGKRQKPEAKRKQTGLPEVPSLKEVTKTGSKPEAKAEAPPKPLPQKAEKGKPDAQKQPVRVPRQRKAQIRPQEKGQPKAAETKPKGGEEVGRALPAKKSGTKGIDAKRRESVVAKSGFVPLDVTGGRTATRRSVGILRRFVDEETGGFHTETLARLKRETQEVTLGRRFLRSRRGRIGLANIDIREQVKAFNKIDEGKATPEELYNIHQAMVGRRPMESLPAAHRQWAKNARAMQDAASQDLVREIELAYGKDSFLAKSVRDNIGRYLAEILTPKGPIASARTLFRRQLKVKSERFKRKRGTEGDPGAWQVHLGKKGLYRFDTEAEAREFYNELVYSQKDAVIKKVAKQRGVNADDLKRDAAKVKVRLVPPFTEKERIEIGFSREPRFVWATSYAQTVHNTETLRAFRKLNRKFGVRVPTAVKAEGDAAIEEWAKENRLEKVTGRKEQLGALEGAYLPKRIAAEVNEMVRIDKVWQRWFRAYLQTWKASKTIWNPPTHMRNVMGNFMFADFAGIAPWNPANMPIFIEAAKQYRAKSPAYRVLVREGVIGGEWYGNEMDLVETQLHQHDTADMAILRLFRGAKDAAGRLYNAEDQLFKLAAYIKYKRGGMSPKAAAREVNRWFPNYAELWRATKWLSGSIFGGPFLAFNEQAIRIGARAALRHPVKVMYWGALPGFITAASVAYLGLDDDEKEMIDDRRSYFQPILPTRDQRGAVQNLDLRYVLPLGNELQRMADLTSGNTATFDVPFLLHNPPVASLLEASMNRNRFKNRQVWKQSDTFSTKIAKSVGHILRQSAPVPGVLTYGRKRVMGALRGTTEDTVLKAIGGALFGINVRKAYVNRKDAFERIKTLAEQDHAVAHVVNRLLDGDIKRMSYRTLTRDLEKNEDFQFLLDAFNESYRWLGNAERSETDPVTEKGILQSIRRGVSKQLKAEEEAAETLPSLPESIIIRRRGT